MPTDNLSLYTPLSLQSLSHSQQGSMGSDPYASSYHQRNLIINNAGYNRSSSSSDYGYTQQQGNVNTGYTFPTPAHIASQQYVPSNVSQGIPLSAASASQQYLSSQSHHGQGHGHGHGISLPSLSHHHSGANSQGLYAQQQYHMSASVDRDGLSPSPASGVHPGYHTQQ